MLGKCVSEAKEDTVDQSNMRKQTKNQDQNRRNQQQKYHIPINSCLILMKNKV